MNNTIKGRVIEVPPAKKGIGQRGPWIRQTVVIEYDAGRYTQKLALECSNTKAEEFGRLRVGDIVTVHYDVTSREYNGNYYTTANAFEFENESAKQSYANGPI